jgi:hypothetical protein
MAEELEDLSLIFVITGGRLCFRPLFHPEFGVGEALHANAFAGLDVFYLEIRSVDRLIGQEPPEADQE